MPIYMKYASVNGEVTAEGHKQWIECDSFSWGVARHIESGARQATSRGGAEPVISEIHLTKRMDAASQDLIMESLYGKGDNQVKIDFTTSDSPPKVYLTITLTDTFVSSFQESSGGDTPSDSFSLNFLKIEYKYTPLDAKMGGSPKAIGWDLGKQTKV